MLLLHFLVAMEEEDIIVISDSSASPSPTKQVPDQVFTPTKGQPSPFSR